MDLHTVVTSNMPLFRKLPVVIEAIQFKETGKSISEISTMFEEAGQEELRVDYSDPKKPVLKIPTSEGVMTAQVNDWIIKGVNGELYPCKPDTFAKTYEPA